MCNKHGGAMGEIWVLADGARGNKQKQLESHYNALRCSIDAVNVSCHVMRKQRLVLSAFVQCVYQDGSLVLVLLF